MATKKASEVAPQLPVKSKDEIGDAAFYMFGFGTFKGEFGQSWRVMCGESPDAPPSFLVLFGDVNKVGERNEVRADQFLAFDAALADMHAKGDDHACIGPVKLETKEGKGGRDIVNIVDAVTA